MIFQDRETLVALLAREGFIAAEEEADELLARAGGDAEVLDDLVRRRLTGEPLAWITGSVVFCGIEVAVTPGVYVPRWHSEPLALRGPSSGCPRAARPSISAPAPAPSRRCWPRAGRPRS